MDSPFQTSLYRASPWQQKFHELPGGRDGIHEALGAGAAGPGKSLMLLMDPLEQIFVEHQRCVDKDHEYPLQWGMSEGWALHLRRTLPNLATTIARSKRIFKSIDPDANYVAAESTWYFKSGYRFQFGHCQRTDDHFQYRSNQYSHIAFDELSEFDWDMYENIASRCRIGDPVLKHMYKVRSCTNPVQSTVGAVKAKDPHWVRRYFVEPEPDGKALIEKTFTKQDGTLGVHRRIFLPATLYDNPDKEFVAQYEETLMGKSKKLQAALLYGSWWITEGSFYGEDWDDTLHVCEPFEIPFDWPVFRSMDWGFKSPGCVLWWAMDPDDNIYCFKEYTFRYKTDEEVAAEIQRIEKDFGLWTGGKSMVAGPADTQLWENRGHSAVSMGEKMAEKGVFWERAMKGPGSRAANAQLFLKRLKDHQGGTTFPGIIFFEDCLQCRQTIPSIMANPNNPEEPLDGGDDHWHDAVLYACAKASMGRASISMVDDTDEWADEHARDKRNRGRDGYGSDN